MCSEEERRISSFKFYFGRCGFIGRSINSKRWISQGTYLQFVCNISIEIPPLIRRFLINHYCVFDDSSLSGHPVVTTIQMRTISKSLSGFYKKTTWISPMSRYTTKKKHCMTDI